MYKEHSEGLRRQPCWVMILRIIVEDGFIDREEGSLRVQQNVEHWKIEQSIDMEFKPDKCSIPNARWCI